MSLVAPLEHTEGRQVVMLKQRHSHTIQAAADSAVKISNRAERVRSVRMESSSRQTDLCKRARDLP